MMRSMLNMLTGKPAPATTAPVNSSQLLSKKRKSSGEQPHEEEQTMEYSAMLKPKLLQQQQANADHDSENNSLLSNSMRSSSISLKSTAPSAALMKKLSTTTTTTAPTTTSSLPTIPSITTSSTLKEESPPKKQKLNSGVALPNPSSNAPLPPMPPAIANMLAAFQLELDSRIERLRTTSEFQISSLTRSFKNELNKVPAKVRSLTLAEFLDVGKYEGDAALVMNESAMVEQNKLETWVAATPKLRTSRKHREMMMATPSHSALLATTQRLTRASARKLNPNDVTGLGIGLGETTLPGTVAAVAAAPAPVIPKINLSDAVYETPSAKNKIRARLAGAMTDTKASAAVVPIASMSIASLMASAVKSGKKKLAPSGTAAAAAASSSAARSITPEPMEVDAPVASTTAAAAKSSRKKLASSRSTRTKATESASERDSGSSTELLSSAPVTDVSGDSEQLNVAEKEEEEAESVSTTARSTRGRATTKGKTTAATSKTTKTAAAKPTRGRKAAAEAAPAPSPVKECEKELESPREFEELPAAPAEEEVAPKAAAKKTTRAPKGTKKAAVAAAKTEEEPVEEKASDKDTTSAEVSMEDIVLQETAKPAAEPKRVTRARAKKGDEPAAASGKGAVSKLLAGLHAEFNETVKNFSKA